jgi:hypothetical protein
MTHLALFICEVVLNQNGSAVRRSVVGSAIEQIDVFSS